MKLITDLLDRCFTHPQMPFALFFAGVFLMIVETIGHYDPITIPLSGVPVAILLMTFSSPLMCLTIYKWGLKKHLDKKLKRRYIEQVTEAVEAKMKDICFEIHLLDLDELILMMIFSSNNYYYPNSDGILPKDIVQSFGDAYPGSNPPLDKLLQAQLISMKPISGTSTFSPYSDFRYYLPSVYYHRPGDIDDCLLKAANKYIKSDIGSDHLTMMIFQVERKIACTSGLPPEKRSSLK